MVIYNDNDRIPFTKRITGTAETNVFICPYGQNIRFKIKKLMVYNEAGTATQLKIFDHVTGITDPPAQGDSTTPMFTVSVPTSSGLDWKAIGQNDLPAFNFNQGMAVVASQANIEIAVEVVEA